MAVDPPVRAGLWSEVLEKRASGGGGCPPSLPAAGSNSGVPSLTQRWQSVFSGRSNWQLYQGIQSCSSAAECAESPFQSAQGCPAGCRAHHISAGRPSPLSAAGDDVDNPTMRQWEVGQVMPSCKDCMEAAVQQNELPCLACSSLARALGCPMQADLLSNKMDELCRREVKCSI